MEVEETRKRKTLASGRKPGQEKQKRGKDKHIANNLGAMEEKDPSNKETEMDKEKYVISSNNNLEDTKENDLETSVQSPNIVMIVGKEDDISKSADADPERKHDVVATIYSSSPEAKSTSSTKTRSAKQKGKKKLIGISVKDDGPSPSVQAVQIHFSADNSSLLNIVDTDSIKKNNSEESFNNKTNPLVNKEEGLSNSTDADIGKKSDVSPVIDLNSIDELSTSSKKYNMYRKRVGNKSSDTNSVVCPSLPVDQDHTANGSSLSGIAEMGPLRKINNETPLGDDLMLSVEKENIRCHVADNSDTASALEGVQRLRNKKEKHTMDEDRDSNDGLVHENGGLLDGFHQVPQASGISEEVNLKVLSIDCKESPSPIGGVMHESPALDNFNMKNPRSDSFKVEEVSFSFQVADKTIMDESSDKACASESGVGSENISTIQKDNTSHSMSDGTRRATTKGNEEREVVALPMTNIAENVVTSDVINIQDKKLEVVPMAAERTLASRMKKKLLVLDLNGLLADIILDFRNAHKALNKVGGKSVFKRPFCDDFLKFCFERFDIGIWSSRKGYNVDNVVNFLMGDSKHRLLFCWDQSKCTLTGFKTLENVHKPLILKELKKLWNKEETDLPWEKGEYSPSNTLLVDDSPYKALCNPPHTAIFPYPYHFDDENDTSLGPGGDLRIYLEGLAVADDVQHYVREHQFGQHAITASDPSWNFYLQVIDKVEKSSVPTSNPMTLPIVFIDLT